MKPVRSRHLSRGDFEPMYQAYRGTDDIRVHRPLTRDVGQQKLIDWKQVMSVSVPTCSICLSKMRSAPAASSADSHLRPPAAAAVRRFPSRRIFAFTPGSAPLRRRRYEYDLLSFGTTDVPLVK